MLDKNMLNRRGDHIIAINRSVDQRSFVLSMRESRPQAVDDLGWKKWDIFIIEVGVWNGSRYIEENNYQQHAVLMTKK